MKQCRFCGCTETIEKTQIIDAVDMRTKAIVRSEEVHERRCFGCKDLQFGYSRKLITPKEGAV